MQRRKAEATRLAVLAIAAALLAGCQSGGVWMAQAGGSIDAALRDATIRDADWDKKVDVTITIRDYGYQPRELRLRAGQPYRITLVNQGSVPHYFTAPVFLQSAATRKVEVRHQAEVKAPVFSGFELKPRGGSLDVYLVPLRAGTYRAYCHIKDHLAMGVEGTLIVE